MQSILVINAGSSSLKYQLIDIETEEVLAKGLCERIGIDGKLTYKPTNGEKLEKDAPMKTHQDAIALVLGVLVDPKIGVISDMSSIAAVGHRVVHGGTKFTKSVLIDDEVIDAFIAAVNFQKLSILLSQFFSASDRPQSWHRNPCRSISSGRQ